MENYQTKNGYVLVLLGVVYALITLSFWFEVSPSKEFVVEPVYLSTANPLYAQTNTLIMIPGHGVMNAPNATDWRLEKYWAVEKHQLRNGVVLPFCFASHIRRGVMVLKDYINSSLLIFSGGQTRNGSGPRSEGLSYYVVAEETRLFGLFNSNQETEDVLRTRVFAEEFARDSYENLLFSIARFYEITGRFPENIIVVGWKHKEQRFVDYHRDAIRFPLEKFSYIGLTFEDASPFVKNLAPYRAAKPYNDKTALSFVRADLYLCKLGKKTREERNAQFRVSPYEISSPPLRHLLRYCGPTLFDQAKVPWM